MAQDIRDLFKEEAFTEDVMPENHEKRFHKKLEHAFPESHKLKFSWLNIAASVTLLIGLSFGMYSYFQPKNNSIETTITSIENHDTKTLGDVSPGLKKVEDYYLASINLELSKIKYTSKTKEVFDGYLKQLGELNKEYERLSLELTTSGPTELMVNALIDNLKFRLNLLYRLKAQLKDMKVSDTLVEETKTSI